MTNPALGRTGHVESIYPSQGIDADLERLRADLARAVSRVCPPWLASRSEDLVQIAMIRVMKVQRRREGTVELSSSYLKKAAYSAVVDEIRRQRRSSEVPLEQDTARARALDRWTGPRALRRGQGGRPSDPQRSRPPGEGAAGGGDPPSARPQRAGGGAPPRLESQAGGEPHLSRPRRPARRPRRRGSETMTGHCADVARMRRDFAGGRLSWSRRSVSASPVTRRSGRSG